MSVGRTLVAGQSSIEPGEYIHAWIERRLAESNDDVCVYRGMSLSDPSLIPNDSRVHVQSTGMLGTNKAIWDRGQLRIIPARVSAIPGLFADGTIPVDVLAIRAVECSGGYTPGIVSDYIPAALSVAKEVVIQVDGRLPVLPGAPVIPHEQIAEIVHLQSPGIPTLEVRTPEPVGERIGEWVASVIRDGDTVQLGLGSLGPRIAEKLGRHRRHLGIHTGLLDDAVMDLLETGAVDNSGKDIDRGWSVTPIVMGSTDLYRRVGKRSDILLRPVHETNNPSFMSGIPNFVAVNSALEVDLTGQVNAECIHGTRVSTTGGQLDYVLGSRLSPGGRSMTVLPSTAGADEISRIVPIISSGCVTVPGPLIDYIVTEYGVADLRGKDLEQRGTELIAIAHPRHRDMLRTALESDRRIQPQITRRRPARDSLHIQHSQQGRQDS